MPAKVILEVLSGPITGKVFAFETHDTFLFGRHGTCHAQLPNDGLVSRYHFVLEANPPDARLRDLGSQNGTLVNGVKYGGRAPDEKPPDGDGRPYPAVDLKHGDRITVGNTNIQVQVQLPTACCQCSAEIPESDRKSAEWVSGSFMCLECRIRTVPPTTSPGVPVKLVRPPSTVEYVPRCERCGKDASAEVRNGRRGSYVCDACRGELVSPGGGLRRLMQQAARQFRGQLGGGIAGYDIGRELGVGGMGLVFLATRKSDQQDVAIKVMLPQVAVEESAREMFLREISVTRELSHPHIVGLLDSGSVGNAFYFVMEFCNRGSLNDLMDRHSGKLALATVAPLIMESLSGLEHAHRQNIVHRDLKPHNVLLQELNGRWTAKISDFGLAKNFERAGFSGMTATGGVGGTLSYMPREQLTQYKRVRAVSDVWSIGATLYNAITGSYPLEFPPKRDRMEVILRDEPVPVQQREPSIPASVAAVIDRSLATDTAKRFQTAAELRVALELSLRAKP